MKLRTLAVVCATLCACGSDGEPGETVTVPASFTVRPGVEIATVIGAEADVPLTLYDGEGNELVTVISDGLGFAHFAYIPTTPLTFDSNEGTIPVADGDTLKPGDGYVIRDNSKDPPEASEPFTVMDVLGTPDTSLYDSQVLNGVVFGIDGIPEGSTEADGFNYIEMRDGVKLSAMVRFPDPRLYGDGPYPTLIEYSGYSTSRLSSPEPGSRIATLLGYATVGVNMRGSGCSGGVFDVFNPAQHADGYDIVEAVARQPWVLHNKVGMVGLSYSGISQLYVGRTRPPSLAAITPMSVIGDAWEQLWPGGIFNDGFTRQWLEERDRQQSSGGQDWTVAQIESGDTECEEHQAVRGQNVDFQSFFRLLEFYPKDAVGRSLPLLVDQLEVPVYLTGAWQDEQTGPQFAAMLDRFENVPTAKFTMFNGRHPDGYSPLVLTRWYEFVEFYVAQRVPRLSPLVRAVGGEEFSKEFGVTGLGFEPDRFPDFADEDLAGARAAYEAEPRVRVLFESGAGATDPGSPAQRFEATYATWPPPNAVGRSFYLGENGALTASPTAAGVDTYQHDPDSGSSTFFGPRGYELLVPIWDINWTEFAEGNLLSYLTDPFTEDTVFAGPGYVELYFESEVDDANIQVTLTEIRSDNVETLITSGWLRAGHRQVDEADSDEFRIRRTYKEEDFQPLVPGEMVPVRVAIPSFAHAFRAGSQLRLMISTPGRNHGTWQFTNPDYGGSSPTHAVGRGGMTASRVYLPQVSGITVPAGYPDCPSLRGQPCRTYRPATNTAR